MSQSISVSIELADKAAQNALSSFISNAGKADKQMKSLNEAGKSAFTQISEGISKTIGLQEIFVGNIAANVVTAAYGAIKGSINEIIGEAASSEQAIKNLNVALRSSGQYSKTASDDLQDFAGNLQNTTIYSDEAVLASASLLLNLTALSTSGIKKATTAAGDLAATLNVDLQTATEMISKAVNGNYTAFGKLGIEIKNSGTEAGRLTNILSALASQQGKAKEQSDTYEGATKKNANAQSELYESLGKLITQSKSARDSQLATAAAYASAAKFITDNTTLIRDLGTTVAITAGIGAAAWAIYSSATLAAMAASLLTTVSIASSLGVLSGSFAVLSASASTAWAIVTAPVTLVVAAVAAVGAAVYYLVKNWDDVKAATYNAIAATLEFAAVGAKLVSSKLSESLTSQAQGYRDQAKAINEAKAAAEQKALADETNTGKRKRELTDAEKDREKELISFTEGLAKKNQSTEENQKLQLENLKLFYEQRDLVDADADTVNYEDKISREQEFQIQRQAVLDANFAADQARIVVSNTSEATKTQALLALQKKYETDSTKSNTEFHKKKLEFEKQQAKEKEAFTKETLNNIATLAQSGNQTLATIGKAAAIAQIAIDTPLAIAHAIASNIPYPGNFIAAGLVGVAMAAQAARVAGVNFEQGGIVPGTSFSGDRVAANVNSGEMILNRTQQAELFKVANGDGGNAGLNDRINSLANSIRELAAQPISIMVDGKELFNVMRVQTANGRAY